MQTFLPYADFNRTAQVLDRQRLGKQRVETLQIMKALADPEYGWQSHPAVKMWRGYEGALMKYQMDVCHEWTDGRGYKDTCLQKTLDIYNERFGIDPFTTPMPLWMGGYQLHRSHQSNLLRKAPEHYGPLFQDVPDDLEYVWPVI